jgi:hypothetical protein
MLLEKFFCDRRPLEAKLQFENESILVKQNEIGIRGLFAAKPFNRGDVILAVPKIGGIFTS